MDLIIFVQISYHISENSKDANRVTSNEIGKVEYRIQMMFTSYSVLSKEVLLEEYEQNMEFCKEAVIAAAEGKSLISYDGAMRILRDAENNLNTVKEALKNGFAYSINTDDDGNPEDIVAFAERADGKMRCWEEMLSDEYEVTDVFECPKDCYLENLKGELNTKREDYRKAMRKPETSESFRQFASVDRQLAEVEYNTALQAEKNGKSVGYVMLEGDLVFEVRHELVGKDRIKVISKKLYIEYFRNTNKQ